MNLELAHRTRPKPGETANGDAVWCGSWIDRPVFAVFDGSGHGPFAAEASAQACATLEQWHGTPDMPAVAARLHERLRRSRGCAGLVAMVHDGNLLGFGVGNVELRALGRPVSALLTPGVLGTRLRRQIHVFSFPLQLGDRLITTTDGIRGRPDPERHAGLSPGDLCDSLMQEFAREIDDATVLVADVVGP